MAAKSFDQWMHAVDVKLEAISGLSHLDLADYAYYDAYDAGESAASVAKSVLAEEGFPF
jgi:hypothetical protein